MSIHKTPARSLAEQARIDEFDAIARHSYADFVEEAERIMIREVAERHFPPSNNMGGNLPLPPLFFPHREKLPSDVEQKTKIDWLAYTVKSELSSVFYALEWVYPGVAFQPHHKGMKGFKSAAQIVLDGVQLGLIGYGASHGRIYVSITGVGVRGFRDAHIGFFFDYLSLVDVGGRLSRLDICFDMYHGERTYEHAVWAYENGHFKQSKGGRQPQSQTIGVVRDGCNMGRTLYVGKRGGFVMARIYEKGLEVFANMPEDLLAASTIRELQMAHDAGVDAVPFQSDKWLRVEVEFSDQGKDQRLPLEMLLLRDQYFVGAYPYCSDVLGAGDGRRPKSCKSEEEVSVASLIGHARRSYGSLIHSMREMGFSESEVVNRLSNGRNNSKLVRSGALAKFKRDVAEFEQANPDFDVPF